MKSFFLNRYERLGQEIDPEIRLRHSIRMNTLKISEKELAERLKKRGLKLEKIPFLSNGYYAEAEFALSSMPEHLLGYFYIQEAASQIPPELMELEGTDMVLDMAASPGSKTSQIAQIMQNKGQIIALEAEALRLKKLRNNLERLGVSNTTIYHKDALYCADLGLKFDKILVDAPCSGNFATDPKWIENMQERGLEGLKNNSELQKKLLKAAIGVLKPNGLLIYSTCSLEPEENELNVDWLLGEFEGQIELEKINLNIGEPGLIEFEDKALNPELSKTRRLWPNKTGTQGFFIAKIRKL